MKTPSTMDLELLSPRGSRIPSMIYSTGSTSMSLSKIPYCYIKTHDSQRLQKISRISPEVKVEPSEMPGQQKASYLMT